MNARKALEIIISYSSMENWISSGSFNKLWKELHFDSSIKDGYKQQELLVEEAINYLSSKIDG